jgi:uncharacterized membrane protein YqgA involved in biofilm formation
VGSPNIEDLESIEATVAHVTGIGTAINVATVIGGTTLGLLIGGRIPERARTTMLQGVGLVVIVLGIIQAQETQNLVMPLVAVVIGGLIGELVGVEERLEGMGERIRKRIERGDRHPLDEDSRPRSTFVEGFVAASLVFCVGPITILGSIDDGLRGDPQLLIVKATLDGLVAIVFASTLGIGVGFSALVILIYQGSLTLAAGLADRILDERMTVELTATGGLLMLGLALRLLEIKPIRVGSYLPALVLAPLIVALFAR